MAYMVAHTLKMRPLTILTEWGCEELLVTFAYYANMSSKQNWQMMSPKDRAAKRMSSIDQWAVPFITTAQLKEMNSRPADEKPDLSDNAKIAEVLFG